MPSVSWQRGWRGERRVLDGGGGAGAARGCGARRGGSLLLALVEESVTWWPPDEIVSLLCLAVVTAGVCIAYPLYRECRWRIAKRQIDRIKRETQAAQRRRAAL